MDLLKRDLAPITAAAWQQIDAEAKRVLAAYLTGRQLVDLDGPHGWQHAAVNTGHLSLKSNGDLGVPWGVRHVLPLIEIRAPIVLRLMELDNAARGAVVDLAPVAAAAEKMARAEDRAIFVGSKAAGIDGIIGSSGHATMALPANYAQYPAAVAEAVEVLRAATIEGPYALALAPDTYAGVSAAADCGQPLIGRLEVILGGKVVRAPEVDGGVVVSVRGGDFCLSVGQDFSIGYVSHDREKVELYLTESFTFRVIERAAAVYLKPERRKK